MARNEQDREDLLAEATALVERAEWLLSGSNDPVVAGFRRDGSPSIFFGADPVYQFTRDGHLRRAFVEGRLIKAVEGRLVSLTRRRTAHESQLVRHDLTDAESTELRKTMAVRLEQLNHSLAKGAFSVVGQIPREADVAERFGKLVPQLLDAPIAQKPNVE